MVDSNNSPIQKIYYFKVGEYLEAIRYLNHKLCVNYGLMTEIRGIICIYE